jgi:His-Xaa-Ser system protein HxsD
MILRKKNRECGNNFPGPDGFARKEEVSGMLKKTSDSIRVVKFDSAVYGLRAIGKAAWKFRGSMAVYIQQRGCVNEVRLIQATNCNSFYALVREFCSEVLDQELRERVAREMVALRDLLLAGALAPALEKCA